MLIAVQPTRGLDVGAIEYIHKQLLELRNTGHAVLLISLEMEEVLNISDPDLGDVRWRDCLRFECQRGYGQRTGIVYGRPKKGDSAMKKEKGGHLKTILQSSITESRCPLWRPL